MTTYAELAEAVAALRAYEESQKVMEWIICFCVFFCVFAVLGYSVFKLFDDL